MEKRNWEKRKTGENNRPETRLTICTLVLSVPLQGMVAFWDSALVSSIDRLGTQTEQPCWPQGHSEIKGQSYAGASVPSHPDAS